MTTPSASDASLALLRALVDEIKSCAHDPATVHLVADKLKHGIDVVERALTEPPKPEQKTAIADQKQKG